VLEPNAIEIFTVLNLFERLCQPFDGVFRMAFSILGFLDLPPYAFCDLGRAPNRAGLYVDGSAAGVRMA
jgi:hypothetical protein